MGPLLNLIQEYRGGNISSKFPVLCSNLSIILLIFCAVCSLILQLAPALLGMVAGLPALVVHLPFMAVLKVSYFQYWGRPLILSSYSLSSGCASCSRCSGSTRRPGSSNSNSSRHSSSSSRCSSSSRLLRSSNSNSSSRHLLARLSTGLGRPRGSRGLAAAWAGWPSRSSGSEGAGSRTKVTRCLELVYYSYSYFIVVSRCPSILKFSGEKGNPIL